MASGFDEAQKFVVEYGEAPGSKTGNGSGTGSGDKTSKTLGQSLKKLVGIDLGMGALLKQSQIFTGYLGNVFAIVGAMIDTILAPLAPIAFKALADLGKKIPMIAKVAEKWIPKIVSFIGSMFRTVDRIGKFFSRDWAKWAAIFLGALIAINLTLKLGRLGGSVLGLRSGGAARGIISTVMGRGATQAATGAATTGATTAVRGAAGGGGMLSRFAPRALGTVGKIAGGVGGGIIGAVTSYAGGRNKGMSKGMSIGRGVTAGLLGAGGAVLGSALGPLGTVAGGAMGVTAGNWLFDKMFAPDQGGGSSKKGGMDVAGQQGLAGYSAPMYIASSAKKFSDQVNASGEILAEAIMKTVAAVDETPKVFDELGYDISVTGDRMIGGANIAMDRMKAGVMTVMGALTPVVDAMKAAIVEKVRTMFIGEAIKKDPTLAFSRTSPEGFRTHEVAMKIQREQIMDELIGGKKTNVTGGYSLASSMGFTGTDFTVSGSGNEMIMREAFNEVEGIPGKEVKIHITYGGHDGTQQIIQYEQNGKQVFVKMEEDYSTFP